MQLIMGSSMMRIRRLTCMVMLIQIGQAVPLIVRALWVAALVLGSSMISWFSRKKFCVELSTIEEYYVSSCSSSTEVVWIRKLLFDLFDL